MKYFTGEDTYAAREALGDLATVQQAVIQWRDADELKQWPVQEWLGQGAGLFGRILTVFRDVQQLSAGLQEQLVRLLTTPATGLAVVWERQAPDRQSRLWKQWGKQAEVFSCPTTAVLKEWLVAIAGQQDSQLLPAAAERLIAIHGTDRWRLKQEIEKLTLREKTIEAEQVEGAEATATASIFAILEELAWGKTAEALAKLERMWEAGESELYILTMLAYQFRVLAAIKSGQTAEFKPFVIQKNSARARRWSRAAVTAALTKILATDFAIKQGKMDPRTGITMLVLSLGR